MELLTKEIFQNDMLLLEIYREAFEDFTGFSTTNNTMRLFTEEEQVVRYAKVLAFWHIQRKELEKLKGANYAKYFIEKDREGFFQRQIFMVTKRMKALGFCNCVVKQILEHGNELVEEHQQKQH